MDKDYSELIEYLDHKFSGVDDKFSGVGDKFSGVDDKFDLVSDRFSGVERFLEDLKENKADKKDIRDLTSAVDAYAKRADDYFQEMIMLGHKVDRHEKWIQQIAGKLDIKLSY